jgi:uncharacterized protein
MKLTILENNYSIYKFIKETDLPEWIYTSEFYSVTKTMDELSVVAVQNDSVPGDIICNKGWRIIKVEGPLDFSLVGIIADLSEIFKKKKIPIFVISTYDTDYILLKEKDFNAGIKALIENGHDISYNKKASDNFFN